METVVERSGALDVHKEQVTACVRVPDSNGKRVEQIETFRTTVRGLLTLHDWLAAHGVTQVAMEATGVYWKPVWAILEDDFDCLLVNARHVKQSLRGCRPQLLEQQGLPVLDQIAQHGERCGPESTNGGELAALERTAKVV